MLKRLVHVVLASLVFAGIAGRVFAQDSVKLTYKFTPGELLCYTISYKESGGAAFLGGSADTVTEGTLRLRVVKVLPNGDAQIRAAYQKITIRVGTTVSNTSADTVKPIIFWVSKSGVIRNSDQLFEKAGLVKIRSKVDGETETTTVNIYEAALDTIFTEYPDRDLKVGETWKIAVDGPDTSNGGEVVSKVDSIDSTSATIVTTWDVKDMKIPSENDRDSGAMTASGTLNTKTVFSKEKGCTESTDESFQMTLSSEGDKITTKMSTQISLISKEDATE